MWCRSLHIKDDHNHFCEVMNFLAENKYEKHESILRFITYDNLIKMYLEQVFNQWITVL